MAYILRWRHDTNDLTPAIESLGPGGQHMLTTSKKIVRNNFFDAIKVQQSRKSHYTPYKPHTRATRDKKWSVARYRNVSNVLRPAIDVSRRAASIEHGLADQNCSEHPFLFFWVTRCLVETWGNLVGHFMRKVVGEKPDGDHIRDARE